MLDDVVEVSLCFVTIGERRKAILVTTNVLSFIHFNLIHFCFSKFTPSHVAADFFLISFGGERQSGDV
jgi:hypothetical protein